MKKAIGIICAVVMSVCCAIPAFATCKEYGESIGKNCVDASIIVNETDGDNKCYCDEGDGSGVTDVLTIVLNVMTVGVGVLAVLGIVIMGIQYMTAGGDVAKMQKAKTRIIEIVIGLLLYALLYVILRFLSPSFTG